MGDFEQLQRDACDLVEELARLRAAGDTLARAVRKVRVEWADDAILDAALAAWEAATGPGAGAGGEGGGG